MPTSDDGAAVLTPPPDGSGADAEHKPPELVIDPSAADAVLVRDIVDALEERFDLDVVANGDHVRSWGISR